MRGKAYGIGVGPGDPELMTLKAVKTIKENHVVCVPGKDVKETTAYKIAVQAVPELKSKELVPVYMPMVTDREELEYNFKIGAKTIEEYLDKGENVVFLTLGDPAVYSTFTYLQHIMKEDGYETEIIPGITSFCAAASRLNIPLCEWDEPLHIIPAFHNTDMLPEEEGNYVLMKSGRHMKDVKDMLLNSGRSVYAVENCGMEGEKVYRDISEIPDDAGYFSIVIAK